MPSPLTEQAKLYTWRQLAQRAGIVGVAASSMNGFESLGVSVHYGSIDCAQIEKPALVVLPCAVEDWNDLLVREPQNLDWMDASEILPQADPRLSLDCQMPVLFWGKDSGEGNNPFVEQYSDNTIVFNADIVAGAFFMLSRWEETVVPDRDEYGRFPATASVAYKQGFLDRPIVDEYSLILREWLKVLLPDWEPAPRKFSIKLSHDIDQIRHQPNSYWALRTFAGDLLKRCDPTQALRTATDAVSEALAPRQADFYRGIFELMALSKENDLEETAFYVMTADPKPPDNDYDLASPLMQDVLDALVENAFEIGFHAGYHTFNHPDRLAEEKKRLDALLGTEDFGGRQHYLRFQAPDTWRHWEHVGLTYDSTLGYADHEGFRCGTSYPFRPFDIEQNRELDLWEVPLIAMDGTFRQYRDLTPEQSERCILALARRCRQVGGTFTLLWHNSSLRRDWRSWGEMYRRILKKLSGWDKGNIVDEIATG